MAETRPKFNDQQLVRIIRRAVDKFTSAETDTERLAAVMLVSSLSAVALLTDKSMATSTAHFIETKLGRM